MADLDLAARRAAAPTPSGETPAGPGATCPRPSAVGRRASALLVTVPLYSPARWLFVGVLVARRRLGTCEVVRALRTLGARPPLLPLLAGGAAMVVLAYRDGAGARCCSPCRSPCWPACVWRLAGRPRGYAARRGRGGVRRRRTCRSSPASPPCWPRPTTGRAGSPSSSPPWSAATSGGYAAGVLFGKHPMAPSVSPKKSWEGFAGSVLACVGRAARSSSRRCSTPPRCSARAVRARRRLHRHARRPGRVDDQARHRHQGHGPPAARATAASWTGSTRCCRPHRSPGCCCWRSWPCRELARPVRRRAGLRRAHRPAADRLARRAGAPTVTPTADPGRQRGPRALDFQ